MVTILSLAWWHARPVITVQLGKHILKAVREEWKNGDDWKSQDGRQGGALPRWASAPRCWFILT